MARALALGFLVGVPIAATPGPIFFLILRRTLARGWFDGAVSGLGVATGDAAYAALAAFGVTAITSVLISQKRWIGLVGGMAIIAIGARIVASRQDPLPNPPHKGEGIVTVASPVSGRRHMGGTWLGPKRSPRSRGMPKNAG